MYTVQIYMGYRIRLIDTIDQPIEPRLKRGSILKIIYNIMQNNITKKIITLALVGVFVFAPATTSAQSLSELQTLILSLTEQVNQLSMQIQSMISTPRVAGALDYQFTQTLQQGSTGEEVRQLQRALQHLGFFPYNDPITGQFDGVTEHALQAFQAAQGIASSGTPNTTGYGVTGPQTRMRLNSL